MGIAGILVLIAVGAWAALGLHVSVTDLRHATIPRQAVWTVSLVVVALLGSAAAALGDPARFGWSLAAAAILGVVLEVCYRVAPDRLGFGDVRLIIANSVLVGWWGVGWPWWALCAGAVAAWPAALRAVIRGGRHARVRCAPGLVLGSAAVIAYRLWSVGPVG